MGDQLDDRDRRDDGEDLGTPGAARIDAAWLTAALARAGVGGGGTVERVDARPIGTGQMGESVRFTLTWREPGPGRPASVVGKFPSPDPNSRAAGQAGAYAREIGFYRDLQGRAGVPTPTPLYAAYHEPTGDFTLLMSDVRAARQGDQLEGCDLAAATVAVDAIVGLHATTWDRIDEVVARGWMPGPSDELLAQRVAMYRQLYLGFVRDYASRLSAEDRAAGDWIADHLAAVHTAHRIPRCVTHNDFRLDNLLFGTGPEAPPVTVVDWQTLGTGHGPVDLAYFVGAGVVPPPTVDDERALVARYRGRLGERGVDVAFDDLWTSYRLGSVSGYVMAVVASQLVIRTTRGDDMFEAMWSRHAAQMRRLAVADLVG